VWKNAQNPTGFQKKKNLLKLRKKTLKTLTKVVSMYAESVRLSKILFFEVQRWPWLASHFIWLALAFASFTEVCDHGKK